jgi:hypothetical protein
MTALGIVQRFYPEVKTVRDATKPLNIEVTKRDINSSAVKNHKDCALAVACKRAEAVDGAIVAVRAAYIIKGDAATRYHIPESVAREIIAFDRSGEFAPGQYRLLKPIHKLGDPAGTGSNNRKAQPVKKRPFRHITTGIRQIRDAA